MANVRLKFYGTESTSEHSLECYANTDDEIHIYLDMDGLPPSWINLDVSTAIKLAKTLRTEINKIKGI